MMKIFCGIMFIIFSGFYCSLLVVNITENTVNGLFTGLAIFTGLLGLYLAISKGGEKK